MEKMPFSKDILQINDIEATISHLCALMREEIYYNNKRRGAVLGLSGGIDSSVTLALAVRAISPEHVLGIMMPEKDSNPESCILAEKLAGQLGVETATEEITAALEGFHCYQRRDEAIKKIFPEFNPATDKSKIGINQSGLNQNLPPVFSLTVINKSGEQQHKIIPLNEYLQIVAASNFKQRCRMAMLYYYAEKMHYSVLGTANKHEIAQGFFVKYGDGAADMYPLAALYKTQVYQLARQLGIPREIIDRTPTTDTYSAEQTQEEFFYQLPFEEMDLLWYGFENDYSPTEVGLILEKTPEEVASVYKNFARKKRTTGYLRAYPAYFS